uniref:PDZ domain-containing protein n=1 Tax=Chitinimonas sp. TaxID=1934313 RepID=UPI0035B133D8
RSTDALPLADSLATVGVRLQARAQLAASDKGGWLDAAKAPALWLGARTASDGALVKLTHVISDGPAMLAGLSAGDVLVAIDGLKASQANLDAALAQGKAGDKVEVLAFRRDELMKFKLRLAAAPTNTVGLKRDDADKLTSAARKAWLGA